MKRVISVIILVLLLIGCQNLSVVDKFAKHIVAGELEMAYGMLQVDGELHERTCDYLNTVYKDIAPIEDFKIIRVDEIKQELILIGKVKDVVLEIEVKDKQIIHVNLSFNDEAKPTKKASMNMQLIFSESQLQALTQKLEIIGIKCKPTDIEYEIVDDHNIRLMVNNHMFLLNGEFENGLVKSMDFATYNTYDALFPLDTIEDKQVVLTEDGEMINESFITENYDEYDMALRNMNEIRLYLNEEKYDRLYSFLYDKWMNAFSVDEFKDYLMLMKQKSLGNLVTEEQMIGIGMNASFEEYFYTTKDFYVLNNHDYYVEGVYEMDRSIEYLEDDSNKEIRSIYYYGYFNNYDERESKLSIDELFSCLRDENITQLNAFNPNLSREEWQRLLDYQKKIVKDFDGTIIHVDTYPTDTFAGKVMEYIILSSEGHASRIILITDYYDVLLDYNVAYLEGVKDEVMD